MILSGGKTRLISVGEVEVEVEAVEAEGRKSPLPLKFKAKAERDLFKPELRLEKDVRRANST